MAAPLASVEKVRRGASQNGTDTRGTSDRDGTSMGSAAMSRAVPRSSARRVRQSAHVSRCACTEARASDESAPSRYAERSPRSEEHTSELQSQSNLVCRLLLEKKTKD